MLLITANLKLDGSERISVTVFVVALLNAWNSLPSNSSSVNSFKSALNTSVYCRELMIDCACLCLLVFDCF